MALAKAAARRFGFTAKRLAFALIAVVLFFTLAEIPLRLLDLRVQSGDGGLNKGLFYFSMKRGVQDVDTFLVLGVRVKPLHPADYRIAAPPRPKPAGAFRVLCLGDSSTYGVGVEPEETYCARLQSILAEKFSSRPVEAVNAGFPGFTSFQGRMLFENYQPVLQPDAVVFYFGANDMTFAPVRQDKEWDKVPAWALKANHSLYQSSRLYCLLRNVNVRYVLQSLVHPFNEKARNLPYRMRVGIRDFQSNLKAVEDLAARSGAKVYVIPYLSLNENQVGHAVYFNDLEYPRLIDLEPVFKERLSAGRRLFVDEVHPSPEGHQAIAELLAQKILSDLN